MPLFLFPPSLDVNNDRDSAAGSCAELRRVSGEQPLNIGGETERLTLSRPSHRGTFYSRTGHVSCQRG